MCNCARNRSEPETLFGLSGWLTERPRDNRSNAVEFAPRGRAYVVREQGDRLGSDAMSWDVLGGQTAWPMTNVRNLGSEHWVRLAEDPARRCLIPYTEHGTRR